MSREPEAGFHHILFYEDDDTRFVLLRPLAGTSKCPKEVAKHLVEIFCAIGAPATVRCAESGDFTSKVISYTLLLLLYY